MCQTKNYNEDTARKNPNVVLVASYVSSIVLAQSTHAVMSTA